jgi:hypothetical protein
VVEIDGRKASPWIAKRMLQHGRAEHGGKVDIKVKRGNISMGISLVLASVEEVACKARAWEELSRLIQVATQH